MLYNILVITNRQCTTFARTHGAIYLQVNSLPIVTW